MTMISHASRFTKKIISAINYHNLLQKKTINLNTYRIETYMDGAESMRKDANVQKNGEISEQTS